MRTLHLILPRRMPSRRRLVKTMRNARSLSLQQLDSIAKGVEHVDSVEAFHRFVRDRRIPGGSAPLGELGEASDQNCRVRLPGGAKLSVDTEMKTVSPPRNHTPPRVTRFAGFGSSNNPRTPE